MMMNIKLPPTAKRVRLCTNAKINYKIDKTTRENIAYYKTRSTGEILDRIDELDREWDIERVLETTAGAILVFSSYSAIVTRKKRWAVLGGVASAFLLKHALEGWCPPLPLFRLMGVRTSDEINLEKNSLNKFLYQ
ncbi:DUF2892 domain-containing protein [Clostridium oryzae]|uniref:DUF2892 domain-containing protein n=1 Tax=Clostridium oryzae TaxID=1450648 RepID=A0A1V4IJE2_9CLOT|nr:DUF2892 domain-containing protein [Clostridium oryzae]OPJ60043.1 hypothetical protein CLORY_30170 [Clostridium oryzae]